MKQNNSPWLTQLNNTRTVTSLQKDMHADIVIVGAGIAGITTLFFLLKYTHKKIVVLDAHKIAHGATGHNAGQVVAEFEKPLKELIHEHGIKKAIAGIMAVEQAWDLVSEIFDETQIDVPCKEVVGYGGYALFDQLVEELETEYIKHQQGMITFPIMISKDSGWFQKIDTKYQSLCIEVEQEVVNQILEVPTSDFYGVLAHKAAVMNSALFTEQLALWCLKQYPDRCQIFENTSVHGIELVAVHPKVITNDAVVSCNEVVLCTNGFENFYIHDKQALAVDTEFHHRINGVVGYMTGFASVQPDTTMANYYYPAEIANTDEPYYYVTKRPFAVPEHYATLTVVGGPEIKLANREIYHREFDVSEQYHDNAVQFMKDHFTMDGVDEKFFWHGLMGYTNSGVRIVGREPLDTRLMYNLGCNGIGILPAIMGARKIADHVNGVLMEDTIFDPKR